MFVVELVSSLDFFFVEFDCLLLCSLVLGCELVVSIEVLLVSDCFVCEWGEECLLEFFGCLLVVSGICLL